MSTPAPALEGPLPTRRQAALFAGKAWGLRLRRALRDAVDGPRRHAPAHDLHDAPVLAQSDTALWPTGEGEHAHAAGKVQNLRVALRALHGLEVPAGAVLSFWKQVGRATRRRGFVPGRELREGCLVPSVGGGLCQLSNALYDCALRAGLQAVERHRHSRVLPGSLAQHDRDATVFWNYVDLRLRAGFAWRLEVTMDARQLRVRIRGHAPAGTNAALPLVVAARSEDQVNDCHSCQQVECHRHVEGGTASPRRLWWLAPPWPEFREYLAQERGADDTVHGGEAGLPSQRGWQRWREAAHWRLACWRGHALPRIAYAQAEREAALLMRLLQPTHTHLVVPQHLLPYLWRDGLLAGRAFEVLMQALPMPQLQAQLDRAAQHHPGCGSLGDFRAPQSLVAAETDALAAAQAWISPHAQVLTLAGPRGYALAWQLPAPTARAPRAVQAPRRVFLPASPLARKGVHELLSALRNESLEILLPPGDAEPRLDAGRATLRRVDSYAQGLAEADVVAMPAWVEHRPRGLLAAIASGVPVVATPACGLDASLPWRAVQAGDVIGLREQVLVALGR